MMTTPWPTRDSRRRVPLSEKLGLEELCEGTIDIIPFPGSRVATLVHALVAGATCIDDADVLRSGATPSVLSHRMMASSTLGTFLRRFSFGHVRQLDRVSETLKTCAWSLRAGPGSQAMTIDVDSTICKVYGNQKQGASYGYTHVLGYHPLLPPVPTPARPCTCDFEKVRPTPSAAPSASCARWWAVVVAPGRRGR